MVPREQLNHAGVKNAHVTAWQLQKRIRGSQEVQGSQSVQKGFSSRLSLRASHEHFAVCPLLGHHTLKQTKKAYLQFKGTYVAKSPQQHNKWTSRQNHKPSAHSPTLRIHYIDSTILHRIQACDTCREGLALCVSNDMTFSQHFYTLSTLRACWPKISVRNQNAATKSSKTQTLETYQHIAVWRQISRRVNLYMTNKACYL